jgi:hypothetical protein
MLTLRSKRIAASSQEQGVHRALFGQPNINIISAADGASPPEIQVVKGSYKHLQTHEKYQALREYEAILAKRGFRGDGRVAE